MARKFCIPGIVILFAALVLSFLVSLSLPFLTRLDIARIQLPSGFIAQGEGGIKEYRFGIWAACYYDEHDTRSCLKTGLAYITALEDREQTVSVVIGPSWTRGLAVHPIATAVTFVAFLMSFSTHLTITLLASLTSFLAAVITLIAFAVDIALFAYVKHQVAKLPNVKVETSAGAGFWMTLVSFVLLLVAGCIVCFGRRKDRTSGTSSAYPAYTESKKPFWKKFRKH